MRGLSIKWHQSMYTNSTDLSYKIGVKNMIEFRIYFVKLKTFKNVCPVSVYTFVKLL